MAFLETRLSPKITAGAVGGPTVPGRTKVYTPAGQLRQNFLASMPIHRYDVSHGLRSAADFQTVLDLWYVVMFTPYEGFRFKDWRDYQLTQANSRLTLISGTTYRINRVHTFGGIEFLRPIYKPTGQVTVYNAGGATLTATTDTATGIVTVPAGTPSTCVGEFDVPVTFTDDEWASTLHGQAHNVQVDTGAIKLEEIRL
jgi:uncharacterized protein (TIGR02217 family)